MTVTSSPVRVYMPMIKKDPTLTPTTIPTPTPTSTPEVVNVPSPKVVILSSSTYTNVNNARYIIGEFRNETGYTLQFSKMEARYFDANGTLLASSTEPGHSLPSGTGDGEVAPFSVYIWQSPPAYSYYTLEMTFVTLTTAPPRTDLTILSHEDYPDRSDPLWHHIKGTVRNDTRGDAIRHPLIATAYDANGVVIGLGLGFVGDHNSPLQPGQETEFDVLFAHVEWAKVTHYKLETK